MNHFNFFHYKKIVKICLSNRPVRGVFILVIVAVVSACDNQEVKSRQTLVRVNGEEITILQMNDELSRSDIQTSQQEVKSKQILESLIDRQLIIEVATRNKLHRSPEVTQAIERAKAQIIESAYLKSITANIAQPTDTEINEYFRKHPELFMERKQYDMQQLVIATTDISSDLGTIMDSASSLEGIATWLTQHNIRYARGQLSRSASDLPEQIQARLKTIQKGQLFIIREGKNSLINYVQDIKNSPVTLESAKPQIEQYFINNQSKQIIEKEITQLRSLAKIEYLNSATNIPP